MRPEDIELEERKSSGGDEDGHEAGRGEMYESRMALSRTNDDIENQKFRTRKGSRSIERYRRSGVSIVDAALKNTKSRVYDFGSMLYDGYCKLRHIMNPDSDDEREFDTPEE